MTDKILYWGSTVVAGVTLILFLLNVCLINGNQRLQGDINTKQNTIQLASNVVPLNQQLSQALYQASTKNNDAKIRELLTSQGFTLPSDKEAKAAAAKGPKVTKEEE